MPEGGIHRSVSLQLSISIQLKRGIQKLLAIK